MDKSGFIAINFSHPVLFEIPEGITIETPSQTEITIKGSDKQLVGQVAADIRSYRPAARKSGSATAKAPTRTATA